MKCYNCNASAKHLHHVVPKSKGGTETVPLCIECHSKVHDTNMSSSYLTRLALLKRKTEYIAYIFWNFFILNNSIKSISKDCEKSEQWVKNQIKKMLYLNPDDLIDVINPILKTNDAEFFNRHYLKTIIIQNQL